MPKLKSFILNDQKYYVNEQLNIFDLIEYFRYNLDLLVIEYNYLICEKKSWQKIFINEGDKIEVVTIVGGG
uniref:Thiamine biosynthesis protein S n=1 Tax=Coscinodiscus radiatus TaxID=33642 RepID=A0A023HAR3_9STRA|nr:thiamine biosynthesis protein S [Coscinodiscus radiatus]AGH28489.1 thiamine biosynthesis protein S [Coscinodiscus radiatus]